MKLARSIVSVFLASLVLVASIGVTVNFHICAGQVQSQALFINAKPCKMERANTCHNQKSYARKSCCENESIFVKGSDTNAEVKTNTSLTPSFNLLAVILPVLYSIVETDSFKAEARYAFYRPPLIEQDITVLVHSFLI